MCRIEQIPCQRVATCTVRPEWYTRQTSALNKNNAHLPNCIAQFVFCNNWRHVYSSCVPFRRLYFRRFWFQFLVLHAHRLAPSELNRGWPGHWAKNISDDRAAIGGLVIGRHTHVSSTRGNFILFSAISVWSIDFNSYWTPFQVWPGETKAIFWMRPKGIFIS